MTAILGRDDIASLLTFDDCIAAVEDVFRRYGQGRIGKSASLGMAGHEGTFHVKAAAGDVFVAKINANFPANPQRYGLPTVQGVIVVMDLDHGSILGTLDSAPITTLRTAAATAVAAKYLARTDARTAAAIGCGVQGRASIEALLHVRRLTRVYLYDADIAAAQRCARDLALDAVICESIDEAVSKGDIVVTCTPAREPILHERHARPGLFIAAVGADNPEKNEVAPALMARCRVVADILEQAATMGDLHHAIAAGAMSANDVHGELSAVICGDVPGRQNDDEMFIFDSTGTALQDVVVASLALERAAKGKWLWREDSNLRPTD